MKLGLLLVVVAAVALMEPNLSEGRTVDKCELKQQLEEALVLPRWLQRHKERILAIVICEANRKSRLDTGLVKVFGKRVSTTAKPPTKPTKPVKPTKPTKPVEPTKPTKPVEPTKPVKPTKPVEPTKIPMITTKINGTVIVRKKRKANSDTDKADVFDNLEEVEEGKDQDVGEISTIDFEDPEEEVAPKEDEEEEAPEEDEEDPEEEVAPKEDEEDPEEEEAPEKDDNEEEFGEEEGQTEEDVEEEEGQTMDHDESDIEDRGERKKRALRGWRRRKKTPWSIGFYGLFQLSDGYFCKSGYRWSRNKCNTSCSAFTDDNIQDDIKCLVKSRYWWMLVKRASRRCRRSYYYIKNCK